MVRDVNLRGYFGRRDNLHFTLLHCGGGLSRTQDVGGKGLTEGNEGGQGLTADYSDNSDGDGILQERTEGTEDGTERFYRRALSCSVNIFLKVIHLQSLLCF